MADTNSTYQEQGVKTVAFNYDREVGKVEITVHEGYLALGGVDHVVVREFSSDDELRFFALKETAHQAHAHWNAPDEYGREWHELSVVFGADDEEELPEWAIEWAQNVSVTPKAEIAAEAARAAVAFTDEFEQSYDDNSGDWDGTWWESKDVAQWVEDAYDAEHGEGAAASLFFELLRSFSAHLV